MSKRRLFETTEMIALRKITTKNGSNTVRNEIGRKSISGYWIKGRQVEKEIIRSCGNNDRK